MGGWMRCANCNFENPLGKKFCSECGSGLPASCLQCGADNLPGAKFCGDCGSSLENASAQTARPSTANASRNDFSPEMRSSGGGERRHLTVLFCDLVGSTKIAATLDPEEWRAIVASYHRAATDAVEGFGGYVAQYLGDGVLAYFGWPEAHDNDAERAARAGIAILEAIAKLDQRPGNSKLSARVGIDSGAVVVAAGIGKDAGVFGDTPNIAARVQTAAAPGMVLITEDTHKLVSGLFVVEDRGKQTLKGIEQPVQLYRVVQPSRARGRLDATAASRGLTPFVGREDELRLLMNRWQQVLEGEGQVALIIGEAGIGKSRLVQRFHEQIAEEEPIWVEAAVAPFFQNTPFYPVAELIRQLVSNEGGQQAGGQLEQLEAALTRAGLKTAEAIPLIAPLLNLSVPTTYAPLALSAELQRSRMLTTLVTWVLGIARVQPLVIVTEDLHWVDPSTLELLQLLVEQGACTNLLLLYTARPEFRAQWPLRAHHTQVTLNRLSARNARTIVGQVAARKALSEETVAAVVDRTGGVPLFVEELTRAVLESGDAKLTGRAIPVTLHDSLMARLDRLGQAKEVIQIGAVIGGEFSYELLRAVHPIAEEELQDSLRRLTQVELLYVRGIAPHATYQFKHALIRDAAYEALLKSRRKDLHRLVAATIDEKFTALKEAQPEVLARHWTEAGETEPAIVEWSKAGRAAQARHAFREALESYQLAMALLDLLPESPERDIRELELRHSVVRVLMVTRGYAAPETIEATERAVALAEKGGTLRQLVNLIISRATIAFVSGDLPAAGLFADQALDLGLRQGSANNLGSVHGIQLQTRYWRGDLAGAEKHFATGLKFFDDPGFKRSAAIIPFFGHASWNAWTIGRADAARDRMARMMAAANAENPYDLALSGYCASYLLVYMREFEEAQTLAEQALELCEKHQFPYLASLSRCFLGQARAQLGHASDGAALIRQGLAGWLEIGSRVGVGLLTTYLAEAQEREGAIALALETAERALQVNPDELVSRPEALRTRGELHLGQGDTELAAADFREAVSLARSMGAKALELRASTSFARLLNKEGHRAEAHAMLNTIHGWFTEGLDTRDLREAKVLLDELSATSG
jgi:class 3 adenylate cyclase/tetratricopeptide (TPR) repeat protein